MGLVCPYPADVSLDDAIPLDVNHFLTDAARSLLRFIFPHAPPTLSVCPSILTFKISGLFCRTSSTANRTGSLSGRIVAFPDLNSTRSMILISVAVTMARGQPCFFGSGLGKPA